MVETVPNLECVVVPQSGWEILVNKVNIYYTDNLTREYAPYVA